jgi:GNAT superfamily N-acetyltransferase
MPDFEIYTPTAEEVHSGVLGRRMRQFNYGFVGEYGQSHPVWLSARDAQGELVGGLRGFVFLQWLTVELLFVDEAVRHQGVGRHDLGAHSVTLNTFEWQAKGFYVKQGYEEFGHVDNYIQGFQLVYLKKSLTT